MEPSVHESMMPYIPTEKQLGWQYMPKEVNRMLGMMPKPVFALEAQAIKGTAKGNALLHSDAVKSVYGKHIILKQGTTDCVANGAAKAVDTVKCVQIFLGMREVFKALTANEVIYAGSRHEVGHDRLGRGGGSIGAWAAKFVHDYGTLARGKYGDIDLTTYSAARADKWGRPGVGVPDELEKLLPDHTIRTVSQVTNFDDACDAIFNGCCVTVASNRGFNSTRDKYGCLRGMGEWGHQMCFTGFVYIGDYVFLICENSWGPDRENGGWISGPRFIDIPGHGRIEIPEGAFGVRPEDANYMLRQGDSFAYNGFLGYPAVKINYSGLMPKAPSGLLAGMMPN